MTASISERDVYGHRTVVVDGTVAVGTIYRLSSGMAEVSWFMVYSTLHPHIKHEVTELARRTIALENVTKRLMA